MDADSVNDAVSRRRCLAKVSLFISSSSDWFGGNNRASYMDFFAFFEAVATSLSLKFYVTNEFKMAERLSVEIATFSRFLAFFSQNIPKREKVQSTLD